jgi:hydroxymethylpyrimidine kinase/phosphomethylpyrimidine kinase
VITCLTAQNPKTVLGIEPVTSAFVISQLEAVFAELVPQAMKTGMLFSEDIIQTVARFLSERRGRAPLIVDPVMVATSGVGLLKEDAIEALRTTLLPIADLLTPNVPEAEALTGSAIKEPEDLRAAARHLHSQFGCAVLLKGGHLPGAREAIDIFYDGKTELLLSAPFVRGVSTHGTGCTYAAAIAAFCAQGKPLPVAVPLAKDYITRAIASSARVGRHDVLGW